MRRNTALFQLLKSVTIGPLVFMGCSLSIQAQTPPVDLTELSLADLLEIQLIDYSSHSKTVEGPSGNRTQVGYRFVINRFEDYLDGSEARTSEDILSEYPVVPNLIDQEAHVVSLSHRLSDSITLLVESSYIRQSTDHIRRKGAPFTITTEGFGDVVAMGIFRVKRVSNHQVYLTGGLSLPTGSIDKKGDTPRGKNSQVPYTMQIGSGTYDLQPGLVYLGHKDSLYWGSEVTAKFRLGRNDREYSLGDRCTVSAWFKAKPNPWISPHLKLTFTTWGEIDGEDSELDPSLAAVADPTKVVGTRLSAFAGVEFSLTPKSKSSWIVGFESGVPLYQSLNGPQPAQEYQVLGAITKGF
jgi:hypothetical protein